MNRAAPPSIVYLITEGDADAQNFAVQKARILDHVRRAESFGITHIQIREKKLSAGLLLKLAREAVALSNNFAVKIIINDRADIALAAKADGVHLTSQSIPTEIVRENFPKSFLIGVSAHNAVDVERAKNDGANFAVFSPVFASPDKGEPQGLKALRAVCEKVQPFPVVALGGVDETNFREVLENGANGFAAIRYLHEKLDGKK